MRIELDTDLFAFADYLNDNDCKMVMAAIFHQSNDNLSEKALVAFAPIMAQIDRQREHRAAVSATRSKAMREVHANKAERKPQPQPQHQPQTKPTVIGYENDPFFVEFWKIYPRKKNVSKKDAFRFFSKLTEAEKAQVNEATKAFAVEMKGKDEQYIPHPSTYINGRRWETNTETTQQQTTNRTKVL